MNRLHILVIMKIYLPYLIFYYLKCQFFNFIVQ